ncbi:ABC transporter permease [Ectobacillus ponti]|uniref:ABC transporter permease n=1 Tax=Ectobacillus ponti TaxID=2961894 RepID=A0AA41X5L1_9BACI|nr:ABC transporter permease [Ectobacillus ponti]MCP8967608.1 ABC transporter permease [Ectobacillus ponti]
MMGQLLRAELLKLRRKGFWFLTFLGPFGVVALQMVNYGIRKEYLLGQSENDWSYYVSNVHSFTPLALVLGIVILTSFTASIEDETNAWKQLLALPVSKLQVYLAKFTVLAGLLLLSSCSLMLFALIHGTLLDLGTSVPYMELAKYSFYPYFAALPVLALQLWVATVSQNQGVPITTGIVGTILTFSAFALPDWMPWKWPTLMNQWKEPLVNVWMGIGVGLLLYMAGMLDFTRRDVK